MAASTKGPCRKINADTARTGTPEVDARPIGHNARRVGGKAVDIDQVGGGQCSRVGFDPINDRFEGSQIIILLTI